MPTIQLPAGGWRPREYQVPLWQYLEHGGTNAVAVWHRRSGKDDVALRFACSAAHKRVGNYWHMLPEAEQARKVIWDAINPRTAKRRIDEAFPPEIRKSTNQTEMKVTLRSGSIWQLVGSDNYNSLIGSPPIGVTYSEWSVADPRSHAFLRPILAENNGWSLFIYTSRGYNHGFNTLQAAKNDPRSFAQLLTVDDTHALSPEVVERERRAYRDEYGEHDGDALFRQEYYCDFSASNIGAILGRYVEDAERSGRIADDVAMEPEFPLEVSSDIGFRDTAAWWFWQARPDGFSLVDYDEDSGLDADDWIVRLQDKGYDLKHIWLPFDAKAKTFATKHSALERFLKAFGADRVKVMPQVRVEDRINAARTVIKRCRFNAVMCKQGLLGLRGWSYVYDDERKTFSKDPKHDWASHPGDAFSYGAQVMSERKVEEKEKPLVLRGLAAIPFNELWPLRDKRESRRI